MRRYAFARAGAHFLFLLLPVVLGSCGRVSPTPDSQFARLHAAIDSLRVEGRYDEALDAARSLETWSLATAARPWHRREARRLTETLERITSLDPAARKEMASADSLTPAIARLVDVDDNYVAASAAASRQLEIRSRYLGHDHPDAALTLDALGRIARLSAEFSRSRAYLESAMEIQRATLGPNHPDLAQSLQDFGDLMHDSRGRYDDKLSVYNARAKRAYQEAISILETSYSKDDVAMAPILQSLGSLFRLEHHFDEAEPLYARALKIRRAHFGSRSEPVAENLLWLGYCRLCAGRLDAAERALTESRQTLHELGLDLSHSMGDATLFLGDVAWVRDDNHKATALWEESFRCQTNLAVKQPQGYGLRKLRGVVGERIDALVAEGRKKEAWEEFCRECGPVSQSLLNLGIARRSRNDGDRLDSLAAAAAILRRGLALGDTSADGKDGDASAETPAGNSKRVELARLDAERMVLEQTMVESVPRDSLTLERIQAHLRPDQAMIGWVISMWNWNPGLAKTVVWAFVVRKTGDVQWVQLTRMRTRKKLDAWMVSIRQQDAALSRSSNWPHRVQEDPDLDAKARVNGRKVFLPLLPYLEGVKDLVVITGWSNSMWHLNSCMECLEGEDGRPLNERFAFSYTPSPWVFVHLGEASEREIPEEASIVAVADPLGSRESALVAAGGTSTATLLRDASAASGPLSIDPALFRSALAGDDRALDELPHLPHSREEARNAASVFPDATVLMGPDATKNSLKSVLRSRKRVDVLHLATHALIDDNEPGRSALVLAGGDAARQSPRESPESRLVTADEVLSGWNIDADLVTLSGCETSRGLQASSGEDLGFAQAFFAAGARSLIMSRWKVDDLATALLMTRFYENLTGSYTDVRRGAAHRAMRKDGALQEAQLWLRDVKDEAGRTPFAHPVYWAGFVLIGNAE